MHFGAIFIAVIGFSVAMLLIPQYLEAVFQRNVHILREEVLLKGFDAERFSGRPLETLQRAETLWRFLTQWEGDYAIRSVKRQKYAPFVSLLVVVEVIVFAYSSYIVARGREVPGVIEDLAVGLSIALALLTLYAGARIWRANAFFNRYLRYFKEYEDLTSKARG